MFPNSWRSPSEIPFENTEVNHAKDNMLLPLDILQKVQGSKYLHKNSKILAWESIEYHKLL